MAKSILALLVQQMDNQINANNFILHKSIILKKLNELYTQHATDTDKAAAILALHETISETNVYNSENILNSAMTKLEKLLNANVDINLEDTPVEDTTQDTVVETTVEDTVEEDTPVETTVQDTTQYTTVEEDTQDTTVEETTVEEDTTQDTEVAAGPDIEEADIETDTNDGQYVVADSVLSKNLILFNKVMDICDKLSENGYEDLSQYLTYLTMNLVPTDNTHNIIGSILNEYGIAKPTRKKIARKIRERIPSHKIVTTVVINKTFLTLLVDLLEDIQFPSTVDNTEEDTAQ